jgi:DNA helicase-2/ATP-dependent DNA helicase PcrA
MSGDLDSDQRKAALELQGNLLVEAGPGAGKTRTLVAKALAECEKRAVHILTFTTSAAEEIQERLAKESDAVLAGIKHVGTLHAWCLGYLRQQGRTDELIDDETLMAIAHEVNTRLRLKLPDKRIRRWLGGVNPTEHKDRLFVGAFEKVMRENGLISYDGLLIETLELMKEKEMVWVASPLFLIDEVQDSSVDDLAIYDQLRASEAELWLVGDLQQAIFSFRHPVEANVWNWWGDRPRAELATNYRSSKAVVKALNLINAEFNPRVEIEPGPNAVEGEVKLYTEENQHGQLIEISNRIFSLMKRYHAQPTDIAVLCRTNKECGLVADTLKAHNLSVRQKKPELAEKIPATLWAALGFFRQPSSDWMAKRYLRAIKGDADYVAEAAARAMVPIGMKIFPALFGLELTPTNWARWADILLVSKVEQGWFYERMPDDWESLPWDDIIMRLFEAPGELEKGEGITVTTIHAAKGREWRHVLMPFCDQFSYRPKNGQEEERVFFVGASRAADTLSFFYSKTRHSEWKGEGIEVAMCASLDRVVEGAQQRRQRRQRRREDEPKEEEGESKEHTGPAAIG